MDRETQHGRAARGNFGYVIPSMGVQGLFKEQK